MKKIFLFITLVNLGITTVAVSQNELLTKKMPEVLLSFEAYYANQRVELTWSSNFEKNNNTFTIEKSKDVNAVFEEVTTIKNFGNYSSLINYFEVDNNPYEGISYYRLKQIDADGAVLSSRLVSINNTSIGYASNLIDDETNQETVLGIENKQEIVVLRDEKGLETFSKVFVNNKYEITVPDNSDYKLDSGNYTIIASSNSRLQKQKVFVK